MEGLSKLRPAFAQPQERPRVTGLGNASGIVDGAAAVCVMSLELASKININPIGLIVNGAFAGAENQTWPRAQFQQLIWLLPGRRPDA